ncbi:restriction endonuclease subunit S [Curvibacter sp. RS43]|uniref:restriction endonuclease subunit S n=1 Tax=Curvibacter microcysteis TaxID=3026419 RepID=UPI00235F0C2B|nr:restriction endonuclease subunit S [Curvibacter sp. RS43]MDD0811349.1 restriction endonuclease subunit S [Curvibacter sp. RS43]
MSDLDSLAQGLPPTWAVATLGDLVDYGRTNKAEPEEIDDSAWVLELEDVEKHSSRLLRRVTFGERQSKSTKNRFETGDVLYGKLRPYLNKVLIADQPGFCTTEIVPIKCSAHLDTRFIFHWLKHPEFLRYVEAQSHGMNMPRLGTEAGRAAPVILAPLPEQTRIADQLDTLLARIKACNEHLDAIPALLKRFRQAVLELGLSGDLNTVLREGYAIERDAWTPTTLGEVTTIGTGSTPLRSNGGYFAPSGTPWITSAATGSPYVDQAQEYVTPAAIAAHRLKVYPPGTLLVAMYGEGKTRGQVSELRIHATINQACAAVTVDTALARTTFVKLALLVQYEQMRAMAEGGNQPNLNLSKVKAIPILLPPLREQDEIIRGVESLLRQAEAIEAHYNAIREQAHRLPSQVLNKAFHGELVPQDPNDESATALVDRLAAERSQSDSAPKVSKTRAPRVARSSQAITSPSKAMPNKSRQDEDVKGQPYLAAHLRRLGQPVDAKTLYEASELPVADFYKQLAWEIAEGHVNDADPLLEPARHAA